MSKILKNESVLIVLIVVIAAIIRLLYYLHFPGILVSEDTYSYFLAGQEILKTKIPVSDFRTPVYPLFLQLFMYLSDAANAPILSPEFFAAMPYVLLVQSAMGIASLVFLYQTLRIAGLKTASSFLFTLFITFNIIIFSFERLLLTESLATFLLILIFYLTVKLMRKSKGIYFWLLLVLLIIQTMLRPIFIAFPAIPLFILCLYRFKRKVVIYSSLTLGIYLFIILAYSRLNFALYGVSGITRATDITMLGKILDFNLSIESARDEKFFYEAVNKYRMENREKNPFRFMEYYGLISKEQLPVLLKLKDFDRKVLAVNWSQYVINSLFQIPGALLEVSEKVILNPRKSDLSSLFHGLYYLYKYAQIAFFIIIPGFFFTLFNYVRKRTFVNTLLIFLGGVSLYQIFFAVFFGYAEFGRLILVAQPLLYLYSFYLFSRLFKFVMKLHCQRKSAGGKKPDAIPHRKRLLERNGSHDSPGVKKSGGN